MVSFMPMMVILQLKLSNFDIVGYFVTNTLN